MRREVRAMNDLSRGRSLLGPVFSCLFLPLAAAMMTIPPAAVMRPTPVPSLTPPTSAEARWLFAGFGGITQDNINKVVLGPFGEETGADDRQRHHGLRKGNLDGRGR